MFVKRGMGGSRCGRGRREGTEVLKEESKPVRRRLDLIAIQEQLTPGYLAPSWYAPDDDDSIRDDDLAEYRSEQMDELNAIDLDLDFDDNWDDDDFLPSDYWQDHLQDQDHFVEDYDLNNDPFNCE